MTTNFKEKLAKFHFPTALGLLILFLGAGLGFYLIKTKESSTGTADEMATPKQVRITNVNDTTYSVSWITDKITTGKVRFGQELNEIKQIALDDRDQLSGESGNFDVHHVTVKNLTPNTKYYFKIESGGKQFDNGGKPFEVRTGPVLGNPPGADPVYGTVVSSTGTGAEGVIVYINIAGGAPLSALTKTNGNWALSLATARTTDLAGYLKYDAQATIINLLVQGGKMGTSSAITTTINDSPVPQIVLGKSHDFRTAMKLTEPEGLIKTAESEATTGAKKTGFDLGPIDPLIAVATPSSQKGEVTLDNPAVDGEIINATQPAFLGSGPPGTVLAIEINSETGYTGSATINDEGEWEFLAPQGLTPGKHEITISYLDSKGIEQKIKRSFVIAASGETVTPAITATPSAATSATTDTTRTAMPSTASGVPKPGSGETTLALLLLSAGLIISGLKLKKNSIVSLWIIMACSRNCRQ